MSFKIIFLTRKIRENKNLRSGGLNFVVRFPFLKRKPVQFRNQSKSFFLKFLLKYCHCHDENVSII